MSNLAQAKKLRAERKQMHDEAAKILVVPMENRTAEQSAKFDELMAKMDSHKAEIDRIEKMDDTGKELNARIERRAIEAGKSPDEVREEELQQQAVFTHWARRGFSGMNEDQRAIASSRINSIQASAQGSVDGTEGGYLVPTTMSDKITEAQKFVGGMIDPGVATEIATSAGNPMPFPTDNDTTNEGEIVGENADMSNAGAGQGISFGQITMSAHMFSSKMVLVPLALLQDSAFDLNAFLARKLGTRLGRIMNRKFTVGTGSSEPRGVVTAAVSGKVGATGQTTSVVYADLVDLEHSVDPAYRKGARFMMADSGLKVIKKLVDGIGRPLWLSGIAVKEPDTINGYPYTINTHMADMAANAKSILFGQFSLYTIRRAGGIMLLRLSERYADKGQVAFLAFERADGNLMDAGTNPVKYYANSAT